MDKPIIERIMKDKPENPQAFPSQPYSIDGMTLRDYFAAKAMPEFLKNAFIENESDKQIAKNSYQVADAMLAERSKSDE